MGVRATVGVVIGAILIASGCGTPESASPAPGGEPPTESIPIEQIQIRVIAHSTSEVAFFVQSGRAYKHSDGSVNLDVVVQSESDSPLTLFVPDVVFYVYDDGELVPLARVVPAGTPLRPEDRQGSTLRFDTSRMPLGTSPSTFDVGYVRAGASEPEETVSFRIVVTLLSRDQEAETAAFCDEADRLLTVLFEDYLIDLIDQMEQLKTAAATLPEEGYEILRSEIDELLLELDMATQGNAENGWASFEVVDQAELICGASNYYRVAVEP